jgi:rod shape-determining protein MreC
VLSAPVRWVSNGVGAVRDYALAGVENRQLRAEVADLQRWREQAIALQNADRRLRELLGLKIEPPIPMVSAQIIADARGPYANTRLANAGHERGVTEGNPVISEHGMVGRIYGVGPGVIPVLMLTDIASRTPVLVDRTNARAILTGDGGPNPKLAYMRGVEPLRAGDRILTSGDGGLFPRGLPVGLAVKGLDGSWRVQLYADDAPIDYVRILLFRDFSQLADLKALNNPAMPPLPAAQSAQIAALAKPQPKPVLSPTPSASPSGAAPASSAAAARPATRAAAKPSNRLTSNARPAEPAAAQPPPVAPPSSAP